MNLWVPSPLHLRCLAPFVNSFYLMSLVPTLSSHLPKDSLWLSIPRLLSNVVLSTRFHLCLHLFLGALVPQALIVTLTRVYITSVGYVTRVCILVYLERAVET